MANKSINEPTTLEDWISADIHEEAKKFHCNAYPRQSVADLAKVHEITKINEIRILWNSLETAGANYLNLIELERTHAANKDRKLTLTSTQKRIAKLSAELSSFVNGELKDIQLNSHLQRTEQRFHFIPPGVDEPLPVKNAILEIDDETRIMPELATVVAYLDYAHFIFGQAKDSMPRGKSGRKELISLKGWIDQIASYWVKVLGRDISVDYIGNSDARKPIMLTPFSRFMYACFVPISDATTIQSLPIQLAEYRTEKKAG